MSSETPLPVNSFFDTTYASLTEYQSRLLGYQKSFSARPHNDPKQNEIFLQGVSALKSDIDYALDTLQKGPLWNRPSPLLMKSIEKKMQEATDFYNKFNKDVQQRAESVTIEITEAPAHYENMPDLTASGTYGLPMTSAELSVGERWKSQRTELGMGLGYENSKHGYGHGDVGGVYARASSIDSTTPWITRRVSRRRLTDE